MERFFEAAVLGMAASGFLALAGSGYLDAWTMAVMSAAIGWRALAVAGVARLDFPRRMATAATLAAWLFAIPDFLWWSRSAMGAAAHLMALLVAAQLLAAGSRRDRLVTAGLGFLELLVAAVAAPGVAFLASLGLFVVFGLAALMSAEIGRSLGRTGEDRGLRGAIPPRRLGLRLAALAVFASGSILVLTAGLFLVLPRTADAAFSHLLAPRLHLPGFASEIRLGEIGEIQTSSRPVMHIHLWGDAPGGLKWRGGTLEEFDGKSWSNPPSKRQPVWLSGGEADLSLPGAAPFRHGINYDITYDEISTDALFFAGLPRSIRVRAPVVERVEGGYRLPRVPPRGFHYSAYGLLEEPPESAAPVYPPPVLPLGERERDLELPRLDPRIPALARRLTGGMATDLERARAIERHLRRDYGYTLELPAREPADPLAYFLFTRKRGHCEYFASAMAVMLRSLGIPARVATGFQSGVYNPLTELWLVRASDAHSWVEAWLPGHGWTTFDPTPYAAPASTGLMARMALYLDAAQTFWGEWVVAYDAGAQGSLADLFEQSVGRAAFGWWDALAGRGWNWNERVNGWLRRLGLPILLLLAAAVGLRLAGARLWLRLRVRRKVELARRGQASMADATLLYGKMLAVLARRGYQKPPWYTPAEFAATIRQPALAGAVAEFTAAYNALRFGGRADAAPKLSALLDELEAGPAPE